MPEKVKRLIACGFTEKNAVDTYNKYALRGDWNGLELFVRSCEQLYNIQNQKEDY